MNPINTKVKKIIEIKQTISDSMKTSIFNILTIFTLFCSSSLIAQTWTEEQLKQIDRSWEEVNLKPNPDFLETFLADGFIWVHNHQSMVDSKSDVVQRAKNAIKNSNPNPANITRSRDSRDVKVIIDGSTAIVTGITLVNRGPKPTTYHFMRTYVLYGDQWKLIANHTMAIPDEEL